MRRETKARMMSVLLALFMLVGTIPAGAFSIPGGPTPLGAIEMGSPLQTDMAAVSAAAVPNQTHTGLAITPSLTLTYDTYTLTEGVDYSVSYSNNIQVGQATATVTGTGDFTGTKLVNFNIVAAPVVDLSTGTVATVADQPFTGGALTPALVVTVSSVTLVQGTDYTVSYSSNVYPGRASYTVTGTGGYAGTLSGTFNVVTSATPSATQVNFSTLSAMISLAQGVDSTNFTPATLDRLDGYVDRAQGIIIECAVTAQSISTQQTWVDDAARMIWVGYTGLEPRYGSPLIVVVTANPATVWNFADVANPVASGTAARGTTHAARLDYGVTSRWTVYVSGLGNLNWADVLVVPSPGYGDPYSVVCLGAPVKVYQYPYTWAPVVTTYAQSTQLSVRTLSDGWVAVEWKSGDIGYIPMSDVKPLDGQYPAAGTPANPNLPSDSGSEDPDPNLVDPNAPENPAGSSDVIGHGLDGAEPPNVTLQVSWPGDDTTGVDPNERLWLRFSNNVSDATKSSTDLSNPNLGKIVLKKADGTVVPARVYVRSTQLYPDTKRYIFVEPLQPLDYGTKYRLEVAAGIKAKGKAAPSLNSYSIDFSTEVSMLGRGEGAAPEQVLKPTGTGLTFGTTFAKAPVSGGTGTGTGSGTSTTKNGTSPTTTTVGDNAVADAAALAAASGAPAGDEAAEPDVVELSDTTVGKEVVEELEETGGMADVWPGVFVGGFAALAIVGGVFAYYRRRSAA